MRLAQPGQLLTQVLLQSMTKGLVDTQLHTVCVCCAMALACFFCQILLPAASSIHA